MASYCIIKGIVESSGTGAGVFVAVFMTGTVVQTDLGPSMITHETYNACTILCYIAQCCSQLGFQHRKASACMVVRCKLW